MCNKFTITSFRQGRATSFSYVFGHAAVIREVCFGVGGKGMELTSTFDAHMNGFGRA